MNCEAGQLVRVSHPDSPSYGAITRVLTVYPPGTSFWGKQYGPIWQIESALRAHFHMGTLETRTNFYPDMALKPILDPGEDAQDETLSWKPVPMPEIVPAMLDRETV